MSIRFGPAGGPGGTDFSDLDDKEIRGLFIRNGVFIDQILVSFTDGSNTQYGGSGGENEHSLILDQGEFITRIFGKCGNFVDSLAVQTNTGRVFGPFGGDGGDAFEMSLPAKYKVVGFFGRQGAVIDAIGIIAVPVPG